MSFSRERQGDLFVLGAILFWSLFPIITVLSYNKLTPLVSLSISSLFASVFFAITITIKKDWKELFHKSAYKEILLATLFNGILYYLLMFFALKFTTSGNVAIVALTEVGFSFLFFHVFKKDYIPKQHILGAIFMIIGAAIVLLPNFSSFKLGDILVILASSIAPFGNFFAQKARKQTSSEMIMLIRSIVSTIVILIIVLAIEKQIPFNSLKDSFLLLLINGFILFGLAKAAWIEGIHRISVTKANGISCIGPLLTLAFASIFLGQTPTVWQLLSLAPICAGVILLSKSGNRDNSPSVPEQN